MRIGTLVAMMALVIGLGASGAAVAVPQLESNDTFGSRQVLAPGTSTVEGNLASPPPPLSADFSFFGNNLSSGGVDAFNISGETAGGPIPRGQITEVPHPIRSSGPSMTRRGPRSGSSMTTAGRAEHFRP